MPMLEGGVDSLTLVRAHRKIEKLELELLRVITNIMFDNIRRKVIELKGGGHVRRQSFSKREGGAAMGGGR